MDPVVLGRDAHHLAAAPRDRADIGVGVALGLHHEIGRGVDFGNAVGQLETKDLGRFDQPFGMFRQLENGTVVNALTFEYTTCIVQAVGQHMDLGIAPRNQFAIEPDLAVAIIEGKHGHHKALSLLDYVPSWWVRRNIRIVLCQHG